jgi:hypothetical protein
VAGNNDEDNGIEPDAYELRGITEHGRETILSYRDDDAGNIEMDIQKAKPLFSESKIQQTLESVLNEMLEASTDNGRHRFSEEQDDAMFYMKERLEEVFSDEQ